MIKLPDQTRFSARQKKLNRTRKCLAGGDAGLSRKQKRYDQQELLNIKSNLTQRLWTLGRHGHTVINKIYQAEDVTSYRHIIVRLPLLENT